MFKKILIANRGEIAVRIMATCRDMDIRTIAVYSDADRNARHVRQSDEAYPIGPAPATESYLRIDAMLYAAQQSKAEAIHPGYGFLSENAVFVEACEQVGITWIGPPATAMRLMSSKIAAKQLARSIGVPTIPGYDGKSQDSTTLMQEAQSIGFPLLIKAAAGGGGKGMRVVHGADDFLNQLEGAQREAQAAFGDTSVLLERLIEQARHIEFQILGDMSGHLIHLGERECSIQRRHQKIIEESPSSALTPALRTTMGEAAIHIAQATGYVNAGTVEFLLAPDGHFYFLEMNTRLQVEHPITELVTGVDLVRHQLYIAAGQSLTLAQEHIHPRGHAIEARLYAEDPEQKFLPSTGTITRFVQPTAPGIRLDSGVESGDDMTHHYDPMLAKLIAYGEDRPAAIARLRTALEHCALFGVKTNISLLHTITTHPAFQEGKTYTTFLNDYNFLSTNEPALKHPMRLPDEVLTAAALHDTLKDRRSQHEDSPWHILGPWRMIGEARRLTYHYQDREYTVAIQLSYKNAGTWHIQIDGRSVVDNISCTFEPDDLLLIHYGANHVQTYVQDCAGETQVFLSGYIYALARRQPPDVESTTHHGSTDHLQNTLTAPMAGTLIKVLVCDGDTVQQRQVLAILSAMKMEHTITAPYDGKVRHIHYHEGAVVQGGTVVIEME